MSYRRSSDGAGYFSCCGCIMVILVLWFLMTVGLLLDLKTRSGR